MWNKYDVFEANKVCAKLESIPIVIKLTIQTIQTMLCLKKTVVQSKITIFNYKFIKVYIQVIQNSYNLITNFLYPVRK